MSKEIKDDHNQLIFLKTKVLLSRNEKITIEEIELLNELKNEILRRIKEGIIS